MDWATLTRELSKMMQRWCGEWWAGVLIQTRQSRTGEGISTLDSATMSDQTAEAPAAEIDCTRLEQFGDVCLAPTDTNAIVLRKADGALIVPLGQPASRPTDAKVGDRGLYSDAAGTRVHLYGSQAGEPGKILLTNPSGATQQIKQDGSIRIDAATNQDIVLNGGVAKVVRVGDPLFSGDLTCEMAQDMSMPPILTVTLKYRSNDPSSPYFFVPKTWAEFKIPGGTAVIPLAGAEETVEVRGRPEDGAPHVKA